MQQLDIEGRTKEEKAIEFMQQHEPEEGYFLGFSGGKDSTVLKHLADLSGVQYRAYYSATGIDPPELCKFIKREHPDVNWIRPRLNFYKGILTHGFPTKFRRWCCRELKETSGDVDLSWRLLGMRAEESWRRARRTNNPDYYKKYRQWIVKPIFSWLEWEVWEYIERYDLPYCSLYDEGFDRLGCVICPWLCNPNQSKLNMHRERWPKIYAAFERTMRQYFGLKGDQLREKTADELIANWYRGN